MSAMEPVHRILKQPAHLVRLQTLRSREPPSRRRAAARRVCREFHLTDARGRGRERSCRAVRNDLERARQLRLPAPREGRGGGAPRRLGTAVPVPSGVPSEAGALHDLCLVPVTGEADRRIWNELRFREHPCGAAMQVGAQLRYRVRSEHGILGALGFSAPALRLASRDRWIGWDETARSQHLNHAVIGRSRFLIRPSVRCRNLGSRVLGRALARLPDEIEARYGYRPLLVETFVDPETHAGTVFAAAGWERVGETTGRGRFARPGQERRSVKAVWMRPLRSDWRAVLGVAPAPAEALGPADGRERGSWTANEFGGAPLGDRRLSRRLVTSASLMADQPGASFPAAARGQRALVTGYYRMIDPPAASAVTPEAILAPHRERTRRRMASCTTVLMIQDGSDLNFATHPKCGELGLIGRNRNASGTRGLHLHSTLAVDADTGIPLGVPRIESDAPDGRAEKGKPLEERKSARWMRGLRDTSELVPDGVRVVSVLDREADFFARFAERQRLGTVDLRVRARHNRSLGKDEEKLFEPRATEPSAGSLEIEIARPSARTSTRTQKDKALREARVAKVSLQFRRFDLPPPGNGTGSHDPVPMTAVRRTEEDPPAGVEPRHGILLTSLPVSTRKEARRVRERYRRRGRIEDWHRVLKRGCKAEFLHHREGHRIERAVTIKAVIAWRLFARVLLGRETPERPAEVRFCKTEILVLKAFARRHKLRRPPDHLGHAVRTLAIFGGYLDRRSDPPPGPTVVWRGYTHMAILTQGCEWVLEMDQSSELYQELRPDKTCES